MAIIDNGVREGEALRRKSDPGLIRRPEIATLPYRLRLAPPSGVNCKLIIAEESRRRGRLSMPKHDQFMCLLFLQEHCRLILFRNIYQQCKEAKQRKLCMARIDCSAFPVVTVATARNGPQPPLCLGNLNRSRARQKEGDARGDPGMIVCIKLDF